MTSIFSGLISSKMKIRILMRIFLNPDMSVYLRELANEFQASPSHVKNELDRLRNANLIVSKKKGRQILLSANTDHPVFNELHSMVKKALGMDRILDSIIDRLGNLEKAILIDDYAEGKDTGIIDLVLIGKIDQTILRDLTYKTEKYIRRKIRTLVLSRREYENLTSNLNNRPQFLLWEQEQNLTDPLCAICENNSSHNTQGSIGIT